MATVVERPTTIYLSRLDSEQTDGKIALKFSSTCSQVILGRGPQLRITDTKISRRLCAIEVHPQSGSFTISALGSRSVYTKKSKRSEEPFCEITSKDIGVEIGEGTVISLLPDSYAFEVTMIGDAEDEQTAISTNVISRPSCIYGDNCIRKNPVHFQDEAHPGDDDFQPISGGNDDDDDKPECEYGIDCYRQNPKHKMEFKHSLKPRPKRKAKDAAGRKKKAKSDDLDGNESYESSFIDDDETDMEDISNDEESVDEWTPDDDDY